MDLTPNKAPRSANEPQTPGLVRSPKPAVLPSKRDVLVVASNTNIGATVVAKFQGLVLADGNRGSHAHPRIALERKRFFDAIDAALTAMPEIPVERHPEARLKVTAKVGLDSNDGRFRFCVGAWREGIAREEVGVRGEEPGCSVSVNDPVSPTLRPTGFGFKGPAVRALVDQAGRIILASR